MEDFSRKDAKPQSATALPQGFLYAVFLGLGVLAVVYARLHIAGSDTYVGLLAPLDRLFDLTLAVAISFMLASLGLVVAQLLKLSWSNGAETVSISLFLGTGVFGLAVLGLGLLGLLKPIPIVILCALSIIISRAEMRRLIDLVRHGATTFVADPELKFSTVLL